MAQIKTRSFNFLLSSGLEELLNKQVKIEGVSKARIVKVALVKYLAEKQGLEISPEVLLDLVGA